jgi:xylan 1,4-beta-xylosidase
MYSSYTAASFARKHMLADKHGVNLEGALTWAFEFEDQPYFAGFRALATNGIDLPVLNVFRMFSRMSGRRVTTESSAEVPLERMLREGVRRSPDVAALAGAERERLSVMVWHYHDDDVPGADAQVKVDISGLPPTVTSARLTHYRVDENHGNAYAEWKRAGSPIAPDERLYARLQDASRLATLGPLAPVAVTRGVASVSFALPRQGVSLLVLDWSGTTSTSNPPPTRP